MSGKQRQLWLIGLVATVSCSVSAGAATWNPVARPTAKPEAEKPADSKPRPTPPPRWQAEFLSSQLHQRQARRSADVIGPDGDQQPTANGLWTGGLPTQAVVWAAFAEPTGAAAAGRALIAPPADAGPPAEPRYRPGLPHGPPARG